MKKAPYFLILLAFIVNTLGPMPEAQADDFYLPAPGVMIRLSPPLAPPILKGIKVYPDDPFRFDFILDKGDSSPSSLGGQLKTEATKLIKYFLASLTIPEKDLWVNLSPYEKTRVIPNSFGLTEMGRDLLAEDYMLKQITASLIYPEDEIGKKFWKRIYTEAQKKFGTTDIPVNTFNKVWIVPEKAIVYENAKAGTAYVVESKLKVMLEQDYLSMSKYVDVRVAEGGASPASAGFGEHAGKTRGQDPNINSLGSQIVREIVIPELTTEVNENKNFARLRQVYNSLILATWYKKKIKDSILARVYDDKNKVAGLSPTAASRLPNNEGLNVESIYQQYLQAFKKGVYNYIKEEQAPVTQEVVPRKYFSGGVNFLGNLAMTATHQIPSVVLNKAMLSSMEVTTQIKGIPSVQATRFEIKPTKTKTARYVPVAPFNSTIIIPYTPAAAALEGPWTGPAIPHSNGSKHEVLSLKAKADIVHSIIEEFPNRSNLTPSAKFTLQTILNEEIDRDYKSPLAKKIKEYLNQPKVEEPVIRRNISVIGLNLVITHRDVLNFSKTDVEGRLKDLSIKKSPEWSPTWLPAGLSKILSKWFSNKDSLKDRFCQDLIKDLVLSIIAYREEFYAGMANKSFIRDQKGEIRTVFLNPPEVEDLIVGLKNNGYFESEQFISVVSKYLRMKDPRGKASSLPKDFNKKNAALDISFTKEEQQDAIKVMISFVEWALGRITPNAQDGIKDKIIKWSWKYCAPLLLMGTGFAVSSVITSFFTVISLWVFGVNIVQSSVIGAGVFGACFILTMKALDYFSNNDVLKAEENKISLKKRKYLNEYYASLILNGFPADIKKKEREYHGYFKDIRKRLQTDRDLSKGQNSALLNAVEKEVFSYLNDSGEYLSIAQAGHAFIEDNAHPKVFEAILAMLSVWAYENPKSYSRFIKDLPVSPERKSLSLIRKMRKFIGIQQDKGHFIFNNDILKKVKDLDPSSWEPWEKGLAISLNLKLWEWEVKPVLAKGKNLDSIAKINDERLGWIDALKRIQRNNDEYGLTPEDIKSMIGALGLEFRGAPKTANHSMSKVIPLGNRSSGINKALERRIKETVKMISRAVSGVYSKNPDKAALAIERNGGIDLTPVHMDLQTQNEGGTIKFHLDPAGLAQLQTASGFTPVIINIRPITNLKTFLGLSSN